MQEQGVRQYEGGQGFVRGKGELLVEGHMQREGELRDERFVTLLGSLPEEAPEILFDHAG